MYWAVVDGEAEVKNPTTDRPVLFAVRGYKEWLFGWYLSEEDRWVDATYDLEYDGDPKGDINTEDVFAWEELPEYPLMGRRRG